MSEGVLLLLFLFVFTGLWLYHRAQLPRHPGITLRRIPGYDLIRNSAAGAAEDGRPLHLSLGTAGLSDPNAMQTVAGLAALEYLTGQTGVSPSTPLVTTANPAALLLAQDTAALPFAAGGRLAQFDAATVRFMGGSGEPAVAAYAAGMFDIFDRNSVSASFLLGNFGDEGVLLGEAAARHALPQVAGSANPVALALMSLTARHLLIGEELFAAGAYLSRRPAHIASLLAHDSARWLIIVLVALAVVLKTLGLI